MSLSYTEKERQKVKDNVSLIALAESMGYHVVRMGAYYSLKEMDSIIIYNDRTWRRWSNKGYITGGSQIDFELAFGSSTSVPEAIHKLLDFINEPSFDVSYMDKNNKAFQNQSVEPVQFVLPPRNDNYRRMFAYLIKTRGLSQEVVSYFVHNKLIYEDAKHHNLVFCGYDPEGIIRYAGMRGTVTVGNTAFKCDVPGNDKNYGVNIVNRSSDELKVFESVIDCMSYMDLTNDYDSNKLILGMVADNPLERFLDDYGHITKISFCLDNDEAGQTAVYGKNHIGYKEKYETMGYFCQVEIPPVGKDWNEFLTRQHSDKKRYSSEDFVQLYDSDWMQAAPEDVPFYHNQRRCR
jgi:hypothetical protein